MKPKLLHLPCSHVITACAESGLQLGIFISPYFNKEAAVRTWGHEIYGIGIVGPFIQDNENKMLFLIQPLRKAKAAVRHVVFGMVWTSPKQARHQSVAANVEHWVTTTRSVLIMHFTMLVMSVLPEIPEMEHLLHSDDHRREMPLQHDGDGLLDLPNEGTCRIPNDPV